MTDAGNKVERLRDRLFVLIDRADLGADAREVASEALDELAVVVEKLQAQNSELIANRGDLEAERQRYQYLFNTVPDGYVITDKNGILREVNATACDLFERPRHFLIGKALATFIWPDDRRAFHVHLSRIGTAGPGAHLTLNLAIQDGEAIPVNLRAAVTSAEQDSDPEIRWSIHDRRQELETDEVRIREERLRAMFESAPAGIMLADAAGGVVFTNRRADELLNRDPTATTMDEWLRPVYVHDRNRVRTAFREAQTRASESLVRYRIEGATELRWLDHGVMTNINTNGDPAGTVSTIIDVTSEQLALSQLEAARDFTDAILDTVGALVVVIAPDGTIARFNRACESVTGIAASDVIGRSFDSLVPEDQRDDVSRVLATLIGDGQPSAHVNDWLTASGERRAISWTNTTVPNPDGSVRVVIGTGIDITDRQMMQQRLAQSERLESTGRLAAGMAHDFNNTLSAIRLRLDRFARLAADPVDQDIAAVQRTIDGTQQIIADLVALGRQQQLHPEPTDVNAEIRRVLTMLSGLLGANINLSLNLADDLAAASFDRARFEQLILNLAINARDAMPEGGTITIATTNDLVRAHESPAWPAVQPGAYVQVAVTDTGVGIDPSDALQIFDPYFTTKAPGQGTGLGLATTHGTLTQSGGTIVVQSELGAGTTFTMWLPCAPPGPADSSHESQSKPKPPGMRVLVVEDDADVRSALVEELRLLGYAPVAAPAAELALEQFGYGPELLITDLELPDMDGAELATRFVERLPNLAVLFMTGASSTGDRSSLPAGATVLAKPFDRQDLLDAIEALGSP